jgi:D-alanyl-D-alanine carboxypeptidase
MRLPRAFLFRIGDASPTDPDKDAALIVDGATGKVLYACNELAERHPASLTKMMTLYLLFDALKAGKVTMQTQLPVSWHAAIQKPTNLNLRPGQSISVDTAIVLAEHELPGTARHDPRSLGGTNPFREMMTARAPACMRQNQFSQRFGPARSAADFHRRDLAILGRHLAYDYPQYFPISAWRASTTKALVSHP